MATVTYLDKARQGRLNALASLHTAKTRSDNVVSIFDFAFDEPAAPVETRPSNVIAFRTARKPVYAAQPQRIAA